jgi:hypothetical protein
MRKQVKISDVSCGSKFYLHDNNNIYTRLEASWFGNSEAYRILKNGYFAIIDNRVVVMDKDCYVYIDVPDLRYKDINVGEKFKIGQVTYLKVFDLMTDAKDKNPCLSIKDSFLYHCDNYIVVERVE